MRLGVHLGWVRLLLVSAAGPGYTGYTGSYTGCYTGSYTGCYTGYTGSYTGYTGYTGTCITSHLIPGIAVIQAIQPGL